ncbi:acyltransferase domain-containing protein [Streptomyces beijiangensis]|uniref:acyltransferase domain-containing protein n=1 Tax=Streptomyces beijiangensis TaxID=163361 RepID=UPI0036241545
MGRETGRRPGPQRGRTRRRATVAGVLDLPDACRLIAARGRLMQALPTGGVMATIVCDEARARAAIADFTATVSVAAVNGPADTVISGAAADIATITDRLAHEGVKHRLLTVSHAFHSPLMAPAMAELRAVAATLTYHPPRIPLVSNVTGTLVRPGEIDADYWVRHAAGTVRFADGMRTLYDDSFRTFLEIGPQPVLSGLGARGLDDPACRFIPTLRRGHDDRQSLMTALGALHLRGAAVDWTAFHRDDHARRIPLPTYAWEGDSYWFPLPQETTGSPAPAGELVAGIGQRVRAPQPTYQLDLKEDRWRHAAHQADNQPYASVGSLVEAAVLAAGDGLSGAWAGVGDLVVAELLPLADTDRTVQLTLVSDDQALTARFEVRSTSAAEEASAAPWRLHLSGRLRRRPGTAAHRPYTQDGCTGTELDWKSAQLPQALADAVLGAERGDSGTQLELAGNATQGRAEILNAATAAVSWAAGPPVTQVAGPDAPAEIGDILCAEPERVRYVQASLSSTADGHSTGQADFYADDRSWLGRVTDVTITSGAPAAHPASPGATPPNCSTRWSGSRPSRPPPPPWRCPPPTSCCLPIRAASPTGSRSTSPHTAPCAPCASRPPPAPTTTPTTACTPQPSPNCSATGGPRGPAGAPRTRRPPGSLCSPASTPPHTPTPTTPRSPPSATAPNCSPSESSRRSWPTPPTATSASR